MKNSVSATIYILVFAVALAVAVFFSLPFRISFDCRDCDYHRKKMVQESEKTVEAQEVKVENIRRYREVLGVMFDTGKTGVESAGSKKLLAVLAGVSERWEPLEKEMRKSLDKYREIIRILPENDDRRAAADADIKKTEAMLNEFSQVVSKAILADPEKCLILDMAPETGLVMLSIGSVNGVFPGLLYKVKSQDVVLRIQSCRSFVSGATVYRGDFGTLKKGMQCEIFEKLENKPDALPEIF